MVRHMLNGSTQMDRLFQALADPSRRAIVERLVRGPAAVSALAEPLPMSLPAVVQHLSVLEDVGLISSEKVGRVRTCRLQPEVLRRAESWIAIQRTAWERRLDRLAEELAAAVPPANPTTPQIPPPKGSR